MRLLGIDYGGKRIGVALSDEMGDFAYPYRVVANGPGAVAQIARISADEGVGGIVLGESRDYTGVENPIMKEIRRFADELAAMSGLPIFFEPELLTSAEAERIQGKTATLDASAAALILRSYIARKKRTYL